MAKMDGDHGGIGPLDAPLCTTDITVCLRSLVQELYRHDVNCSSWKSVDCDYRGSLLVGTLIQLSNNHLQASERNFLLNDFRNI